jgi:ferredoxin
MADTVAITFVDAEDPSQEYSTNIERGESLLNAGYAAGVHIEATCGARGRCRTCRVKILSGEVPPPTIQDTVQLGHEEVRENFRLGCQTKAIANTKVMALPPKAEMGHQILSSSASVTDDKRFIMGSGVAKILVKATTPTEEHHQTSDWEETLSVLPDTVGGSLGSLHR